VGVDIPQRLQGGMTNLGYHYVYAALKTRVLAQKDCFLIPIAGRWKKIVIWGNFPLSPHLFPMNQIMLT